MGKLYIKKSSKEENIKNLIPKKETLKFLLDYSKALRVIEHKTMTFDIILN